MPDVKDHDGIARDRVEDLEWIADQRNHSHDRTLGQPLCAFRHHCDACDGCSNESFQRLRDDRTINSSASSSDLHEIGYRARRILDLHARRNAAKAASISSLLANSPRATWPRASS